jgi:murein DD-endopeptidase MepM/ murein hydrolase activator NlpD
VEIPSGSLFFRVQQNSNKTGVEGGQDPVLARQPRVTVMLVPQTGRRTLTFQLAPFWFAFATVALVGLISALVLLTVRYTHATRELTAATSELESLRRLTSRQQAEIEAMIQRVTDTEQKLAELQQLEQAIRQLDAGSVSVSRSADALHTTVQDSRQGRGGPGATRPADSLPTLQSLLPPEVRAHLFAPHDKLPMHLQHPDIATIVPSQALAKAEETRAKLEATNGTMDRLLNTLAEGKEALERQRHYLAHRPSGLPVSGALLTDRFGYRPDPFGEGYQFHSGLDLATAYGAPVVATGAGTVTYAGWLSGGYGYTVLIDHGYGFTTMYAHLSAIDVAYGEEVNRGDVVGRVGNSGRSTGPHLHYEVHLWGGPVDPAKYIH